MQARFSQASRRLLALGALGIALLAALVSLSTSRAATGPAWLRALVPADTDSVAVRLPDSLLALPPVAPGDTVLVLPDTGLAARYFPRFRSDGWAAPLVPRLRNPFTPRPGALWRHEIILDSLGQYVARERVGETDVRIPTIVGLDAYRQARLQAQMDAQWRDLVTRQATQQGRRNEGGLGFNINIPGGNQSAFTTIFGKPDISLRVNGSANIDGGFNYRTNEQQAVVSGNTGRLDPNFGQDISLGITGMIGDKLRVNVNWDTGRQFDYENQLKLEYTGYEDEILQKVEAGNVFLQTPSTLINGGQRLFGIRSEFQIGGLRLTAVASQQDGQGQEMSLEGGAEASTTAVFPYDYEDNTHFFLGFHFRNWFETALGNPLNLIVPQGFQQVTELEVWKFTSENASNVNLTEDIRSVVALSDLGERLEVVKDPDAYKNMPGSVFLPHPDEDQYSEDVLQALADSSENLDAFFNSRGLEQVDMTSGLFRLLQPGRDYTFDPILGYVTLKSRLAPGEALAVAYKYTSGPGRSVTVGQLASQSGGDSGSRQNRLVLKLIRKKDLLATDYTWELTLRNIYNLSGIRNLQQGDFRFQVYYETASQPGQKTLPGVDLRNRQTLLQAFGLDRLNVEGAVGADDQIDFTGMTLDPANGRIIFPYLRPFTDRIVQMLDDPGTQLRSITKEQALQRYVLFKEGRGSLYDMKKEEAQRIAEFQVFKLEGESSNAVQDRFNIGFNVIEGTVRVTSNGNPLSPGTDYVVDYPAGMLTILNPAYLSAGSNLNVTFEQNQFAVIQKKTLLGLRADYTLGDNLALGGTFMRLAERPPADKFRLGQEPIANAIWGLDGSYNLEPRWLTTAIDGLPLVQTRAPSSISLKGEFAQLLPGHAQSLAFENGRRDLRKQGLDFKSDELNGITFIDDFEGVKNTYSLTQPGFWKLASAPVNAPGAMSGVDTGEAAAERNNHRAAFGWYTIPRTLQGGRLPDASRLIYVQEVYKDRKVESTNEHLPTFDFFFDPSDRGPYNYHPELDRYADPLARKELWGGMVQRIPDSYTDFDSRNIEFIEFIFAPFSHNETGAVNPDAMLYVDLGRISEDVLPNGLLNTEDGLTLSGEGGASFDKFGRYPLRTGYGATRVEENRTDDLGLDGLASYPGSETAYPAVFTEQVHFAEFLNSLTGTTPQAQALRARAQLDPSADDYRDYADGYFENPELFPASLRAPGTELQRRFLRYFAGTELNSFEAQKKLSGNSGTNGNSPQEPSTEDLNFDGEVEYRNQYFQYAIPLHPDKLKNSLYFVNEIDNGEYKGQQSTWYFVRIPVKDFTEKFGNIDDFKLMQSLRVWTAGHDAPVTVRFASLDLVGSQWEKAEEIVCSDGGTTCPVYPDTDFSVSTINNEENPNYRIPNGALKSIIRTQTGEPLEGREQSMVLRVDSLHRDQARAVSKTLRQGEDLLRYANLRMFAHLDGIGTNGMPLRAEDRGQIELFIRLGTNINTDYYEYTQPLTPSDPLASSADEIWQTNQLYGERTIDLNSVNLELRALNQLKVARDNAPNARLDSLVYHDQLAGAPDPESFAPPGTRLGIKGNPSLSGVSTLVIGVRNRADGTMQRINVWVNEMRVTGYDETPGWAALGNATIRLADLANVTANFRMQTDGFGALDSGLGNRDFNDQLNWGITTSFSLHKFLPPQQGWNIPISYSVRSNTTTPRYAPSRGDIRLEEIVQQIRDDETLTPQEKDALVSEEIASAETHTFAQSVSVPISKSGSRTALLRNTLDALQFTYTWSENKSRNPSMRFDEQWQWGSSLSYSLRLGKPQTIRPLWFLEAVPVLGGLGNLRLNYVPSSVTASAALSRNASSRQERERRLLLGQDPLGLPPELLTPIRANHTFGHDRKGGFQWSPFTFLTVGYDSNTNQSLKQAGEQADSLFYVYDGEGNTIGRPRLSFPDTTGFFEKGYNVGAREELTVRPLGRVLGDLLSGNANARTNTFSQNVTASFQPQFRNIKFLDWITFRQVSYTGAFQWQNSPVGQDDLGAGVSNTLSLNTGIQLRPQELWRKFAFYRDMEKVQQDADRLARTERTRREQEQKQQQETRQRAREARRELDALTEAGVDLDSPPDSLTARIERYRRDLQAMTDLQARLDTTSSGGFKLPSFSSVLRRTFLAVTGLQDITLNYRHTRGGSSSNVRGGYATWQMFNGTAPSLAYRLGLESAIDPEQRFLDNSSIQVTDNLRFDHKLDATTQYAVGQDLRVNLTWSAGWNDNTSTLYQREEDGALGRTNTLRGTTSASVWGVGGSYEAFFEKQRARADANGQPLVTETLVEDFVATFLRGPGAFAAKGFLPFPMPSWNINYTGIGKWPLLRRFAQSATLRHGYNATYTTDFKNNVDAGLGASFGLGGRTIAYEIPEFEAGAVKLNRMFAPLIGLNVTWKGGLQTNIQWSTSNALSLSGGNKDVNQATTNEIQGSASYRARGLNLPLPFLGGQRINNDINFTLSVAHSHSADRRFVLKSDLEMYLNGNYEENEEFLNPPIRSTTRLSIQPKIDYTFSNRVTGTFYVEYERRESEGSRVPTTSNLNGGFRLRISFSS